MYETLPYCEIWGHAVPAVVERGVPHIFTKKDPQSQMQGIDCHALMGLIKGCSAHDPTHRPSPSDSCRILDPELQCKL